MSKHDDAVAVLAAAFNDADRSLFGDPRRQGSAGLGIETQDLDEAQAMARYLATFELEVRTTIQHDADGNVARAFVAVYNASDQRKLFEVLERHLSSERRRQFEDLVLARGPIPDDILENIWKSHQARRTPYQIAHRMNELGIIAGMVSMGWTATKIRSALTEYERRQTRQGAGVASR
jgi:hypothetical protein